MPRTAARSPSVEDIIHAAIEEVVSKAAAAIQEAVAARVADELKRAGGRRATPRAAAARKRRRRRARAELVRWAADHRARRVPNFVIEATGLDTKKKIVAKFGDDVVFEKGKPLPPAVKPDGARPPVIRKAAGAK